MQNLIIKCYKMEKISQNSLVQPFFIQLQLKVR